MIIDGVSDGFPGFLDRDTDVMTSPVHLWSFYGCPSPPEPNLCIGSPNSDSDQSWSDAGSPRNADMRRPNPSPSPYQGVRVKVTVKEMIMRKRHLDGQTQHYQIENEYPAIAQVLQRARSELDDLSVCPEKRPRLDADTWAPCPAAEGQLSEDLGAVLAYACPSVGPVSVSAPAAPGPLLRDSGPPVSFFHWQIQQEEQKLEALGPSELSVRDEDGDTFLHIAVAQGRRALAYVLARKMAAVNMLDLKEHNMQTALQVSVAADQHLIAQDLLSLGAEINTLDGWGRSPLHVCAEKGHALTLQAIQRSGRRLDLELVNYDGLAPLHVAVLSHNAVVQELSGHVTPLSNQHVSLLQKRKQLAECVGLLLLMGASLEAKDRKSGRTPLHMAAEEANVELLRLFLDQHNYFRVINAKAFSGNTALHMASALTGRETQTDAVRLLLRRGADPSARNLENEQPAQLVPEGPRGDQVRRILKGKGSVSRA